MKITTWNVNGIRSLKSIDLVLNDLSSDIACFQETKVSRSQIPETTALVDGYTSYFSYPRKQSGYSGVATYCKDKFTPQDAEEGLSASFQFRHDVQEGNALTCWELSSDDLAGFDPEGRIVTTYHLYKNGEDVQRLAVINVYCPRVDPEKLERHVYKMQFCLLLEAKMRELCQQGCSVIIVGDMNISHSVIDHCDPGPEHEFNSSEARQWLTSFLSSKIKFLDTEIGVIDSFRHLHPDRKDAYTCWNTKTGARRNNYGTRIDYIIMSSNLLPILESCEIIADYQGSDHCPVQAVFKCDSISEKSAQLPAICTRLWPEYSGQQQKLNAFFQKAQAVSDRVTNHGTQTPVAKSKPTVKKNKQKSITTFFKTNSEASKNAEIILIEKEDPGRINESSSFLDLCGSDNAKVDANFLVKNDSKAMLSDLPKPPLCKHQQECVLRTVEKKGPSCGKSFFVCSQSYLDGSCNFFQWVNFPKKDSNEGSSFNENSCGGLKCDSAGVEANFSVKSDSSSVKQTMFSRPQKPTASSKYQKECVSRTVKKKGPIRGRKYIGHPQPAGNLSNPNANCNFFQSVPKDSERTNEGSSFNGDSCGSSNGTNFSSKNDSASIRQAMLSSPAEPPLCKHQKECILRTVTKKGPTCGRKYFLCAQTDINPDASCYYFKWVNDPKDDSERTNEASSFSEDLCENIKCDKTDFDVNFPVKNNSSSAWKAMLSGPPKPPLCSKHQQECVLRTVKKKGPNCGRSFFICAQPVGHVSNPDANCNFFQWVHAPKVNTLKKS